jgi:hypothetical protein
VSVDENILYKRLVRDRIISSSKVVKIREAFKVLEDELESELAKELKSFFFGKGIKDESAYEPIADMDTVLNEEKDI